MQVHGPSDTIKDGRKVTAHLNGNFAVVQVGPVRLYLETPEECDWLIAAAVEAKSLLLTAQHYSPEQMAELATPVPVAAARDEALTGVTA